MSDDLVKTTSTPLGLEVINNELIVRELRTKTVIIKGTEKDSDSNGLVIIDKHIQTQQTVAPTISSGTLTNATDVAGILTFTSTGLAGIQTTITFHVPYKVAPIIQITPSNINAGVNKIGYYITSTPISFSINASFTSSSIPLVYYYTVISV
jgi:hypothetical protein